MRLIGSGLKLETIESVKTYISYCSLPYYDSQGRMIYDGASDMEIAYNHLDLPKNISTGSDILVNYSYLANGAKLGALTPVGSGLVYIGPMVYFRDITGNLSFESTAVAAGRMTAAGLQYQLRDHLGSTVAVVTPAGASVEASSYAVFGERTSKPEEVILIPSSSQADPVLLRYHFTGKEDQTMFGTGLPYIDFGARHYSAPLRRWLTPDPLSEKYYDTTPYAYCANNPVNLVDNKGSEPIKPYVGTVADFVRFLNSLNTGIGASTGTMAHAAMLRMGKITFGKHVIEPACTGKFNKRKGRYIYTKKGGWIDMSHFMFYAGRAYRYKLQNQTAKGLMKSFGFIFMSPDEQIDLLQKAHMSPVGETIQEGYTQEFVDSFISEKSAYSYEDLPTDKFGAEFGANYFDPDSELTFAEQLQNYLINVLLATDPQNAPNYENLPEVEPKIPTRTNKTTYPVYVNDNP